MSLQEVYVSLSVSCHTSANLFRSQAPWNYRRLRLDPGLDFIIYLERLYHLGFIPRQGHFRRTSSGVQAAS